VAGLLSAETKSKIHEAIRHYPEKRSAAKAALRLAQEQLGWLSPEAVAEVAIEIGLDSNALYQLSTFYDMFYNQPIGRYVLGVCDNLSCCLRGSDRLLEHLQDKLGISPGETTPDGLFTLKTVDCLAACGNAPVMMVNEEYHEKLTLEAVDRLLEELRQKAATVKGRGESSQDSGLRTQDPGLGGEEA
jgi:NADH-quinone oxidoreductase subunit E